MTNDEFTKLFKYIEKRFDGIDKKLDTKASQNSLDRLTNTVDGFIKRLETVEIEQSARDMQFNRILDWAREVSRKTGIPLKNL